MWRTLIVYDHPTLLLNIKDIVESWDDRFEITTASTRAEAEQEIEGATPQFDLAIVDLNLVSEHDREGILVIKKIRSFQPHCFVILATRGKSWDGIGRDLIEGFVSTHEAEDYRTQLEHFLDVFRDQQAPVGALH